MKGKRYTEPQIVSASQQAAGHPRLRLRRLR